MAPFRCLIVALALGSASGLTLESGVTPIAKVTQLLQGMLAKGKAAKQDEEVKFSAFAMWCENTQRTKAVEVSEDKELIEKQQAKIQKAAVHVKSATSRIAELEADVGKWQADQKSATAVRETEKADYSATATDYTESSDALAGAIATLKKQDVDRPQSSLLEEALIQVQSRKLIPVHAKKALAVFLQQAPKANAYENQSGGVIEMLENLKVEFADKKRALDKEEMNGQFAYEQVAQSLSDNIEGAKHTISKKTTSKSETAAVKAETEGDLAATTKELDEDQKTLDDAAALCKTKSQDYTKSQKVRGDEMTALSKAIEIIGSDAVTGSGSKHLPALIQVKQGTTSLASLRSSQQSPMQERVAAFLEERAKASGSKLLALVSQRVALDPFAKVKKMVQGLIGKLEAEASTESDHKGYCDSELSTNKQTRDSKAAEVSKLGAQIEELTANIASLADDISTLGAAVAELDSSMAKASADRTESKAKNADTVKDAKGGQMAVTKAMTVLKEFYSQSGDAAAFVQEEAAPAVISFLEVILSDFARLEAETTTSEAAEQEAYGTLMQESKKSKALKENDQSNKEGTKVDKESDLKSTQDSLKGTQEQLTKAMKYYETLKPTCVDSGISYEERVKRRQEEMSSLEQALKVLTGSDMA